MMTIRLDRSGCCSVKNIMMGSTVGAELSERLAVRVTNVCRNCGAPALTALRRLIVIMALAGPSMPAAAQDIPPYRQMLVAELHPGTTLTTETLCKIQLGQVARDVLEVLGEADFALMILNDRGQERVGVVYVVGDASALLLYFKQYSANVYYLDEIKSQGFVPPECWPTGPYQGPWLLRK